MAAIIGCPDSHVYECPLRWEHLRDIGRAAVRACGECGSRVHLCETAEQVYRHAQAGRPVAFAGRGAAKVERTRWDGPAAADSPAQGSEPAPPTDPFGSPSIFREVDVPGLPSRPSSGGRPEG